MLTATLATITEETHVDVLDVVLRATLGVVAALVGGPVTVLVFRLVDRGAPPPPKNGAAREHPAFATSLAAAGATLRGGAWIGTLERIAIYSSLLAGWKEMIAVTLAIKGLGRYPELRAGNNPGTAERFIIGTFVSVLFACGCAGLALALTT